MFLTTGSRPGRRILLPAKTGRGPKGLNIESATGVGDTNYQIQATDRYVYINTAFTAARTWTLPPANSVNPGGAITVADQQNTLTNTNTLTIQGSGSDLVDTGSVLLKTGLNVATFYSDGVSKWTMNRFIIAGTAANQLVQLDSAAKLPAVDGSQLTNITPAFANTTYTTNTSLAAVIPYDDTIPQNTEGAQILSLSIACVRSTSKVLVTYMGYGGVASAGPLTAALFLDSGANAVQVAIHQTAAVNTNYPSNLSYLYTPGNTSSHTFAIRVGGTSGNCFMNGTGIATRRYGGAQACTLTAQEIF